MLKICSFLPAATSMIQQLGLEEHLFGVTFECPSNKPAVVRSHIEGNTFSSLEIDRVVSSYARQGKSLYYIDEKLLHQINPDIIITQDVCGVCQIGTDNVISSISTLEKQPKILSLSPKNLNDVYKNACAIAHAVGKEEKGEALLAQLKNRTDTIESQLRKHKASIKRISFLEWINPIYNCGHWIPNQIKLAGGVDKLSSPSGYSTVISWEKILTYNPEIIIVAPCGFSVERAALELDILTSKSGWNKLKAVKRGEVYIADADLFTQPSTKLVDGIELLSRIFYPEIFKNRNSFSGRYKKINELKIP